MTTNPACVRPRRGGGERPDQGADESLPSDFAKEFTSLPLDDRQ